MRRVRARICGDERGAAAVEFAIVGSLFLIFIFAIVAFGFGMGVRASVNHAAAEGARAAISKPTTAQQIDHAETTAYERLPGWVRGHMDTDDDGTIDAPGASIDATIAGCSGAPGQDCITVTVIYPWKTQAIGPAFPGFGIVMPDEISGVSQVQVG